MPIKMLLSGQPNTGKTTLLKSLDAENTLVISRDGKKFSFPIPHKTIQSFTDIDDLITQIEDAIVAYVDKFDKNPDTIVIDSISKILLDIEARVLTRIKSFPYGVINTEITKLTEFLEHQLAANCNLVMVSHTILNADTGNYELVNAGGSWGKKGGMLSEVDNGIFIEVKGKKRVIHHRSAQLAARTTLESLPDSVPIEDYDLQTHINALVEASTIADNYEL